MQNYCMLHLKTQKKKKKKIPEILVDDVQSYLIFVAFKNLEQFTDFAIHAAQNYVLFLAPMLLAISFTCIVCVV